MASSEDRGRSPRRRYSAFSPVSSKHPSSCSVESVGLAFAHKECLHIMHSRQRPIRVVQDC